MIASRFFQLFNFFQVSLPENENCILHCISISRVFSILYIGLTLYYAFVFVCQDQKSAQCRNFRLILIPVYKQRTSFFQKLFNRQKSVFIDFPNHYLKENRELSINIIGARLRHISRKHFVFADSRRSRERFFVHAKIVVDSLSAKLFFNALQFIKFKSNLSMISS